MAAISKMVDTGLEGCELLSISNYSMKSDILLMEGHLNTTWHHPFHRFLKCLLS